MATMPPEARAERARIASLSRSREADDPELVEARQRLRTVMLAETIRTAVEAAPPMTRDQRRYLAGLLTGGARA